eukprot:CAMPEP_0172562544 /NCGR_PEP_ID=MMETSP1067-20121228/97338_1 /TAXON_ID=265564 ORGANISM="Thalassiosira punctigera, Strain Tpunct2005C2" /NCGR_SAMPLE_ID=MMETSP1067 /ASSEMBLY_ACC=CAM_ASM_000444 /LENGTH=59 /DNA_ID=CAMNT_0013352775 /DNA_START=8 /DNA_END=187 /DNA_ORIENTATION=+
MNQEQPIFEAAECGNSLLLRDIEFSHGRVDIRTYYQDIFLSLHKGISSSPQSRLHERTG